MKFCLVRFVCVLKDCTTRFLVLLWCYRICFKLNKIHEYFNINQEYQEHLCSVALKCSTMLC